MKLIKINGQMVEIVDDFKYLGTYKDSSLTFKEKSDVVLKKWSQQAQQFWSDPNIETVYKSLVKSILSFNMIILWTSTEGTSRENSEHGFKFIGKPQKQ